MTGPVTRTTMLAPPDAVDYARVQVELVGPRRRRTSIGSAAEALRDRRLTPAERNAVDSLVRAVQLLRTRARLAGIDDAGAAVKLVLRDADATTGGPWATNGAIAVGARNGLADRAGVRARSDVLLTVDAAVHELAHVVQFGRMHANAKPHPAILEGIADAAAILATGDDVLGEEFFTTDAAGVPRGAIRVLDGTRVAGPTLGKVVTRYADATRPGAEEHEAGGVVSATFRALRARVGRERAEELLWAVIRDETAWQRGGSWRELVVAMRRVAASIWAGDAAASAAVEQSLRATGLDAAAA